MTGSMTIFEVTGSGEFPFRLLASQGCFPVSVKDAERINDSFKMKRTITLKGFCSPSENVWRSYGWSIAVIHGGFVNEKNEYTLYHTWPC